MTPRRTSRGHPSPLLRWTAFQLPGWVLAGLVCGMLWAERAVPGWAALLIVAVWIAKDVAFYPLVRHAYRPPPAPGADLLGRRATARQPLAPGGYVIVDGVLWRAELLPGQPCVPAGQAVTIHAVEGLTLRVSAEPPHAA